MHYVAIAPSAVSRRDTYTYRSEAKLPAGSIVSVPYAGRQSQGIVLGTAEADERAKVATPTGERLPGWQLRFGRSLAELYLAPLGQTLALFLPKWRGGLAGEVDSGPKSEVELRTDIPPERLAGPHTLVLVPERAMLRRFSGAGQRFSATMPIAERRTIWGRVRSGKAGTIFGTRSALFLPWRRLKEVVVLDEDELGHQNDRTPRFHAREGARLLAEAHGARLTLDSPAPSLRAWRLAGQPAVTAGSSPHPELVTPRHERFDDPLPYGFTDKLADLKGSVLVHTVQQQVCPVRDALRAAGVKNVTVAGQAALLADKDYDNVITIGVDAILSRPGFAVTERAVALLRKLGRLVRPDGTFLAYSKHRDHPAFSALGKPYARFLEEEFADRHALSLPPTTPLIRIVTGLADRPKVEAVLEQEGIGKRNVRFVTDGDVLTVLIKGEPGRLRALITPERRISVEY